MKVLDLGAGIGGPSRVLASRYDARVTAHVHLVEGRQVVQRDAAAIDAVLGEARDQRIGQRAARVVLGDEVVDLDNHGQPQSAVSAGYTMLPS
jgi:hypothetical protein